ncbi:hypothetical protein ABZ646_06905, partial [Streptomyces sp. NPDC007162]
VHPAQRDRAPGCPQGAQPATGGADAVRSLLDTYGGTRIVHGHSPIPYLLGEVGSEDDEENTRPVVEGPHIYADGLAIAMDGGVTMAGKLLVRQLPLDV